MKRLHASLLRFATLASAGILAGAGACARPVELAPKVAGGVPPPIVVPATPPPPAAGWPYWEPVPADFQVEGALPECALDDGRVVRADGAEARWRALPHSVRDAVLERGFAVWPRGEHRMRFGAFYAGLARDRVPSLLTLDALFFLAHVARDRALADVEALVLAPALDKLLHRIEVRLVAEQKGAPGDLLGGYRIARGVVAVALALKSGTPSLLPDLGALVVEEVALATAHAGIAKSPLLEAPIDYSVFALRGALEEGEPRAGAFRAATWLAYAPLAMVAATEQSTGAADVGTARSHMRAALLLTRLVQADVDAEASQAWTTVARVAELASGHPADLTPPILLNIVRGAGLDLHDATAIADVVRLDHGRHAVGHARPGATFRLVSERAAPDAAVLQALVAPLVARRTMPSALDVGAWLGSASARAALHDAGADAYVGYADALARQYTARPAPTERHASFYLTALDGIASYVGPSAADSTFCPSSGEGWQRHKLEAALVAWTQLRHDSLPFSRFAVPAPPPSPKLAPSDGPPIFVEPHPEAIARLVGLVRHIARGLTSLSALAPDAPSRPVLAEVDAILTTALQASIAAAADQVPSAALASATATIPARIAALEALVAGSGADQASLVVDVHADQADGRVLEEATGELDDLLTVVREAGTGRLVLVVGPALAHHELERPSGARLSDTEWRAVLTAGVAEPPRDPFTSAFVRK